MRSESRLELAIDEWNRTHAGELGRVAEWKELRQERGVETLPAGLIDTLTGIVAYVSCGRGYIGVEPYPDAVARMVLGELSDYRERAIFGTTAAERHRQEQSEAEG